MTQILRLNPTFWQDWGTFPMGVTPHCGQEDQWDPSHPIPTRPAQPGCSAQINTDSCFSVPPWAQQLF